MKSLDPTKGGMSLPRPGAKRAVLCHSSMSGAVRKRHKVSTGRLDPDTSPLSLSQPFSGLTSLNSSPTLAGDRTGILSDRAGSTSPAADQTTLIDKRIRLANSAVGGVIQEIYEKHDQELLAILTKHETEKSTIDTKYEAEISACGETLAMMQDELKAEKAKSNEMKVKHTAEKVIVQRALESTKESLQKEEDISKEAKV